MELHSLLTTLSNKGIKLSANGSSLEIDAPKGVITPELRNSLAEHKAEILKLLHQSNISVSSTALPTIVPAPKQRYEPFPLTDMQHAFWIGRSGVFELGDVGNHGYYEIEGKDLNLERLNWALQQLIQRHDMLRAVVLPDGQQQILEQVPPYPFEVLDLIGQNDEFVKSQLEAIRERMSHQVLPADRWPLFEFRATRLDEGRVRLHISYDLLIFDAWSLFRLFEQWFQLYQNPEVVLLPLKLSFRDYALAEQRLQETQLYQRSALTLEDSLTLRYCSSASLSRNYWLSRIDTLPLAPDLPLAKSPHQLKQYRCKRYESGLDRTQWQQLKQRAAQVGLTPSGVLLAAFAEIITVWSKSPQFTLNLALFNRLPLHPQVNEILGGFTSATLLAVDNSASESFSQRAIRLQKQLWQDLEHRYFSGVQVMRELARRKGTATSTMPVIFTSTLGFSSLGQETLTFSHFGELVYGISQASQAWMDIQVWEEKGTLTFNWDVVEELFPEGLIQDMFEAYCRFLQQLATSDSVWVETRRNLIPPAQLAQRDAINATDAPVPDTLLHELFTEQVQRRRNELAIISPERSLTYQELCDRSNQVAHRLRKLGATPNQLVAVVMEKGWEQIVAIMGILASGAAYVPIDPGLPEERFSYLLRNSETDIVLTQSWLNEKLSWPKSVHRLCIDSEDLAEEHNQPLESVQTREDLAYLIYTSGSTGVPKGVMINHQGAVNTIIDINQRFGVSPTDRVLALSSLSFDLSVYDIFGTLAAGGTIVIPKASFEREPSHWEELIVQHNATIWNSVPALMQMMVDYAQNNSEALASLRLVLLSGDWLPLTLPTQIKALVQDIQVISLGGATEASIWSILYPIPAVDPAWKSIPYGRPMTNQRFYVLNQALEPCPVWVPGQLYIGGIGLALGYWRQEAKTAASFITHPRTGERLYRTGDLGRFLPDGTIEFLGREDFQVKIGGYRIELGEIEAVLVQHPAVDKAVVTVAGEQLNSKRLVAYLVPNQEIPTDELRRFLRGKLPEYMLPSAFVFLDAFPLSANGKVDRRALPTPDGLLQELNVPYVPPKNEIEKTIARVVQDVMQIEKVGVNDNFFDLGVNSLLIIKIYNKLREKLPDEVQYISLIDLFNYSTICALSKHLNFSQAPDLQQQHTNLEQNIQQGKTRLKQRFQKSRLTTR
jgi:amino acid adenylation domain-containing protein